MGRCWLLAVALVAVSVAAVTPPMTAAAGLPPITPLELIAEPAAGNAPFLEMIDGARNSIELTMYELYDTQIESALAAATARGVDVRVLLNGGYYGEPDDENTDAFAYLRSHGVQVRYAPTYFALTHQKTLTVDGDLSAIMTLNFDGEYERTRDFAILDRKPADVHTIVAAFDADWAERQITPLQAPDRTDLVWSPGAAPLVLRLIEAARHSIDLENEEMDYAPATAALCAAAQRGVRVKIVMTYESKWKSAFSKLQTCGASIRLYYGQSYYIHAKLLLVDGRTALVGSQNLSSSSLNDNRELGILVTNAAIVDQLAQDFTADYAGGSSS